MRRFAWLGGVLALASCGVESATATRYEVLEDALPHDHEAFTEGLVWNDARGTIVESTGLYGGSLITEYDAASGEVLRSAELSKSYFGEGITIINNEIHMLTYKSRKGFVFDANTFELLRTFKIHSSTNEGWGLANDGENLIMSDGSENLIFLNPHDHSEVKRIAVYDTAHRRCYVCLKPWAVTNLNELEYVQGYILANIWHTNTLAKIDPETGLVVEIMDFTQLYPQHNKEVGRFNLEAVMNGIAWDGKKEELYLTGKMWPRMFKVKLHENEMGTAPILTDSVEEE
ncbi:unnamed protein product [Chrysoparadoxa australica]